MHRGPRSGNALGKRRIAPPFPLVPVNSPSTTRRALMTSANGSAQTLQPAAALAQSTRRFPGESTQDRTARNAPLAEEFELRRHIERVAAQRRALPPGAEVKGDYRFMTEDGERDLAGLFGDKETLVTYSYMFGPQRERPCPMCTNLLDAW